MILLELFIRFFSVGLFAVGGGLATIPFLREMSIETGWFTQAELLNLIAVSESTPGAIGVNMATYVGVHIKGIIGGVVATIGLVTPAIIVIILIAGFLVKFKENKYVKYVFYGLRPASTALIAAAGVEVAKISLLNLNNQDISGVLGYLNYKSVILSIILYFLIKKYKKHPAVYIALSAVIGIIFKF